MGADIAGLGSFQSIALAIFRATVIVHAHLPNEQLDDNGGGSGVTYESRRVRAFPEKFQRPLSDREKMLIEKVSCASKKIFPLCTKVWQRTQ